MFSEMIEKDAKTIVLEQTAFLKVLFGKLRDENTNIEQFRFAADRIIYLLLQRGFDFIPVNPKMVHTATGFDVDACEFSQDFCSVAILRSGEAMEKSLLDLWKTTILGKILVQRDEETLEPKFFFSKIPKDISKRHVFLLDPMLATGGSAGMAIKLLKEQGVLEEKIIFVTLISCPEGINRLRREYPNINIITACIDEGLNDKGYIVPGLGDFGDRYFGV
ncbi:MAG: uracil phosphoribosyltransferase [Nanoarchaeota archaeon]|nr:uracil phosphoribosyltransferase [Nanoarchaeota archaeon]MBU1030296.1 uracil phosphoribosyltransferase [Nanoarchaeota archaeon]MBU1849309.1 uracil phosphoribosyltransferase [Nanoarchaeota archaeon]